MNRLSNEASYSSIEILFVGALDVSIMNRSVIVGAMLMSPVIVLAQTEAQRETLPVHVCRWPLRG